MLSRSYAFNPDRLAQAIAATFARRGTPIPTELPDTLTRDFAEDAAKQKQWTSFTEAIEMTPVSLPEVMEALAAFLMPHAAEAKRRGT